MPASRRIPAVTMAWLLAGAATAVAVRAAPPPDPRSLPSVVMRWRQPISGAERMVVDGGSVYVQAASRLVAMDASTGAVQWDHDYPTGSDATDARIEPPVILGDAIAIAARRRLFVIERATGQVRRQIDLEGEVSSMVGPPLVVAIAGGQPNAHVLAIDPDTVEVRARRDIGDYAYSIDLVDGMVAARLGRRRPDGSSEESLVGLRATDLAEKWRLDPRAYREFESIAGGLFVRSSDKGDSYVPIDPVTGGPGRPLPPRNASARNGVWKMGDLDVLDRAAEGKPVRLQRTDLSTGQPLWVAEVPCYRTAVRAAGRLYVLCGIGDRSKGYFAVVDLARGTVERLAAGPADARDLSVADDLLIAITRDGVVAYSTTELGPMEALVHPVKDEVRRLLRGNLPPGGVWADPVTIDLQALGREALPFIVDEVPTLEVRALQAAARALGEAAYTPGGPALARRLEDVGRLPVGKGESRPPLVPILEGLSRTAGAAQVPAIAAVLSDPARDLVTREAAFHALAGTGTAVAGQALDAALAALAPPRPTWDPPSPLAFADIAGQQPRKEEMDRVAAAARETSWAEFRRLRQAADSVRIPLADGGALVVFHDLLLGANDLWAAEVGPDHRPRRPAVFLGYVRTPDPPKEGGTARWARLSGRILEIDTTDSDEALVRVDLDAAARDADGDGLNEAAERRLHTDPDNPDSDGDGLKDAEDPAPDSARRPVTEEEAIVAAVFRQFQTFQGPPLGLTVVHNDVALAWEGRSGRTITYVDAEADSTPGAIYRGPTIRIRPHREDERLSPGLGPLGPDERHYVLSTGGAGHDVIVRRIGPKWYVRSLKMTVIV